MQLACHRNTQTRSAISSMSALLLSLTTAARFETRWQPERRAALANEGLQKQAFPKHCNLAVVGGGWGARSCSDCGIGSSRAGAWPARKRLRRR